MAVRKISESKRSKQARNFHKEIKYRESKDSLLRLSQKRIQQYERIVGYQDGGSYITTGGYTTVDKTYWMS
jgi:hypothetical protein